MVVVVGFISEGGGGVSAQVCGWLVVSQRGLRADGWGKEEGQQVINFSLSRALVCHTLYTFA